MGKIRRGKIFVFWTGDDDPRHAHVYRDRKLVLKWDLTNRKAMRGKPTAVILRHIRELQVEGKL
jgi:hypothetical protein